MNKIAELLLQMQGVFSHALNQAKRNFDKMGANDKAFAISDELKRQKEILVIDGYFWVQDVFEEYVIVRVTSYYETGSLLLRVPYVIADNNITFGSPEEVEAITTYLPIVTETEDGETNQSKEVIKYELVQGAQAHKIPLYTDTNVYLRIDQSALEESKKKKHTENLPFKQSVATVFGIKNANNVYFPEKVWQNNLEQLNQRAANKQLVGEADHPEKPSIARQCILYTSLTIEKNQVFVDGEILNTSLGRDLMAQAASGIPLPLSSRGYGSVKLQEVNGEKVLVVQDDFYCETFDVVTSPAAFGSYINPEDLAQSKPVTPPEKTVINQSKTVEGVKKTMDPIQKKLAMLQGQIDALKLQGQDVTALEQEFAKVQEDLSQMQKDGVPEGSLMTFLSPFGEKVGAALTIAKPGDPDKNAGKFDPSRTQSEEPSKTPLNQGGLTEAEKAALAGLKSIYRDNKIATLLQGVEGPMRSYLQPRLEKLETAEEVSAAFESLVQDARDVISLSGGMGVIMPNMPSGVGLTDREKRYQNAPKTRDEAIIKLTEGVEETKDEFGNPRQDPSNKRWVLQRMLNTMALQMPQAMNRYLALAQGRIDQAGEMTTGDLTTANAALFPIIRRAYPRLIAHMIASIQPMDSDTGTIYYLDSYNEDGALLNENHYYTYSDNTELGTAKKIKIKLTSDSISATSKKLQTEITYETIQDLMFKFGLDAQDETMDAAAAEIAREWNNQILVDLAFASGTAGNTNYGLVAPSGYTAIEWHKEQLFMALQKASNNIYSYRYEEMTHIICGSNTALYFSLMGAEGGFIKAQGDEKKSIYAGLNKFGTVNGLWEVWTSPLLDQIYPNKAITLRKGERWSDTPYVFAPYCTAVTPAVHTADTFKVNQGIMDRAGRKIVVPRALGSFTFQPGVTGTPIGS